MRQLTVKKTTGPGDPSQAETFKQELLFNIYQAFSKEFLPQYGTYLSFALLFDSRAILGTLLKAHLFEATSGLKFCQTRTDLKRVRSKENNLWHSKIWIFYHLKLFYWRLKQSSFNMPLFLKQIKDLIQSHLVFQVLLYLHTQIAFQLLFECCYKSGLR